MVLGPYCLAHSLGLKCAKKTSTHHYIITTSLYSVKDLGLKYLKMLVVNQQYAVDLQIPMCHITQLTFTCLDVDRDNVFVRFQQGSGLQFEFRDLNFIGKLQREICSSQGPAYLTGGGVDVTIRVRLIQTGGHLSLEIPSENSEDCKVQAESIHVDLTGKLGLLLNPFLTGGLKLVNLFPSQLCDFIVKHGVPKVNTMLAALPIAWTSNKDLGINLDYSLSGNVMVTANSLDVPFTGVVYYDDHGDHGNHNDDGSRSSALPAAGVVPVFTDKDSNRMAYVGVSEDLFKSAGQALYDHGPFELTVPQVNSVAKFFLNKVGLSEGPVEVQLTGVPVIKINKDGVSVKVEAIAQSLDKPDLPVECKFGIKVDLNGHRLILQYLSPK
ncbi:lipopolysaccharide-binding protein-like [Perca flavescens]|uniref:lipopolysaccharide-binding protein-like n=1 Tax=Perca flavescens TaxID=8167 RepID=UPI00106EECF9|nr:lipopolysaccharide-binding protein-like [Perca flavescens]